MLPQAQNDGRQDNGGLRGDHNTDAWSILKRSLTISPFPLLPPPFLFLITLHSKLLWGGSASGAVKISHFCQEAEPAGLVRRPLFVNSWGCTSALTVRSPRRAEGPR